MSSYIFEMKSRALTNALDEALPEIKQRFGKSIDRDHIIDTIGAGELMSLATQNMVSSSVRSIRGEPQSNKSWIDIPSLYEGAVNKK